ncbi:HTH-type transcriptional activator HxlR [Moorella thermoacetica]|uniref:HTH-type transcriptional activator HxlR n=1 Tax=Neomoorella thermoacetica TaxID=1525 RepID=A0A1J5NNP0_NEOTH|nr:HTH-type transcriptional activator HxlR [Moorella thermoacetica]OIQ10588.1 HTH-type transcriptional activator HxlR [Moorella thermoacetica]OIQ59888.1 HTH-type transcriptional activator HxlR [Moorella thermoacetica]
MVAKVQNREEICPVTAVQRLIAGKWKIVILWHLSHKTRRFNELQKLLPEVSRGVLTQQLRDLERDGLVHREVYKEVPPKVEYSLTEIGQSFIPVLDVIAKWGKYYINNTRLSPGPDLARTGSAD